MIPTKNNDPAFFAGSLSYPKSAIGLFFFVNIFWRRFYLQPIEQPTEQPVEQPTEQPDEQPEEQPLEHPDEQ